MPPTKDLTHDQRLALINAVLDLLEIGASVSNLTVLQRFVAFLRGNADVINQLIDWLFSDSGQVLSMAADSPVMLKAQKAGIDNAAFLEFLSDLQKAVAIARDKKLDPEIVDALKAEPELAKLALEVTTDGNRLSSTLKTVKEPKEESPEAEALERQGFSFADLIKYLPILLQILQAFRPKSA